MPDYNYTQFDDEPETVAVPMPYDEYWEDMHEFIEGEQGDDN